MTLEGLGWAFIVLAFALFPITGCLTKARVAWQARKHHHRKELA